MMITTIIKPAFINQYCWHTMYAGNIVLSMNSLLSDHSSEVPADIGAAATGVPVEENMGIAYQKEQ